MGRGQGGGLGHGDRRRRHDHPPPCGRPGPPPLVRPPATRAVRGGPPGCKARCRPSGRSEPRGPRLTPNLVRMETLTGERPTAPSVAESPAAPTARSTPMALLVAMRPAGVDQEPARVRGPAVLGQARPERAGPRRDPDLRGVLRDLERRLPVQRPSRRTIRPPASGEAPSPIASGALPASVARPAAVALAAIGLGIALLGVSAEVTGFVALYGATTVAYSLVIKRLVILDVMTIASLFILRVVAGAVAVEAHASEWLILCTGMLALFLGFTKRRQEAMSEASMPAAAGRRRAAGDRSGGAESEGGIAGDPAGARALLAAVPRPDGRHGHRRGDHQLRDLRGQQPPDRQPRCWPPSPRCSTGSSATST